uniref:RRM domain-containing protein n=1 Tax=Kalanchoe fedtschenkoi TaxID=63787 RepID=A0A7N0UWT7_KALFE
MNFVGKELRVHMENKKDKEETHQRELADGEIRKDSMEQERQKIDMSFQKEFDEKQKEREFRAWDPKCKGKSQEIQRNKESKGEGRKMNFMETATIKRERETEGKNSGREEMRGVNKRYITERDVISKGDSHEREWDRVSGEIIQKRDFYRRDSRKQGREGKMHVAKETNFEDGNRGSMEVSQEIELGRKTREGYQKSEFLDRDKWDSEDRQNIFETDAASLSNEERQYRGVDKEVRERSRRCAFVDRDTWKPDIEIRDKTSETEVMHRENERDLTTWDLDKERSQQEFFNEEENSRREVDKRSLEKILENDSIDKENERDSWVRDSGSREKSAETTEGEKSKKLQDEQEEKKCREQHTEAKDEEAEDDVGTESERQQKTVFAYQISLEADDRDIFNFFSKAGKVRDVLLVMNPISRHFMGVGHIEFYHAMSIPIAVSLSGQLLHGQPVMVKPLEADNNQVQSATDAADCDLTGPCPEGTKRLCVGNLHDSISEALVRQVFEAFGAIELVQFSSAEAGHCERNCIIQFSRLEDARAALSLNGNLALAGQLIKVLDIAVRNEMPGSDAKTNDSNEEEDSKMAPERQPESALQELDPTDEENNGVLSSSPPFKVDSLPLPSESLAHLMPPSLQAFATSLKTLLQVPGAFIPIVDTVGVPSECLLLKNTFDSNMQTTDDFQLRVKEDVDEKCYKFGKPKEIFADKNSAGCVYLRFEDTRIAIAAQRSLHGRWFDGKMITATFIAPQFYDSKVPNTEQATAQGQPPPAWLPQNYGTSFQSSGHMLAQGQTPSMWLPQTYGPNFPSGQQALPPGPASSMWVPNNNPVAFGNGGQFMQPMMPQGNLIPDMRPNLW